MLRGALVNILTFKFDNRLIHSIKKNRVKLILLGVKCVMLCISKIETTRGGYKVR